MTRILIEVFPTCCADTELYEIRTPLLPRGVSFTFFTWEERFEETQDRPGYLLAQLLLSSGFVKSMVISRFRVSVEYWGPIRYSRRSFVIECMRLYVRLHAAPHLTAELRRRAAPLVLCDQN